MLGYVVHHLDILNKLRQTLEADFLTPYGWIFGEETTIDVDALEEEKNSVALRQFVQLGFVRDDDGRL